MPGVIKAMSFDTLMMKAITSELQAELCNRPVQRVYEPERGMIILHFYTQGRQPGLLFSTDSKYARVHVTYKKYQSQAQPSPFCMLLRKYLIGGRAISFTNPPLERVLEIDFDPPDGMPKVKLIAEIMSRRSNLILISEDGIILGAARTASWDKNPVRAIQPGEKYRPAPPQDKLNPLEMDAASFNKTFNELITGGKSAEQALFGTAGGISPLTAKELLHRSGWDNSRMEESIAKLFTETKALFAGSDAGKLQPVMLPARSIYAAMPLTHLPPAEQQEFINVNEMLDRFYATVIRDNREKELKNQLNSAVEKRLSALYKKLREQEKELQAAAQADQFRLYGELLLAYADRVPVGAERVVLPDIYNPDEEIIVPLNPSKSASTNAQKHFSRYRKAKKGQDEIKKHLGKTRVDIKYCEELLYTIENNADASLEEIRQEMIEAGFLREKLKNQRKSTALPQPLNFKASSGRTILVGRNNRQNDYITFKAAVRRDSWFHVRQLPGGHVILKDSPYPPPPEDSEEAAFLAAYFSRGRDSGAVAVDYTEVRHVRRRPGGKPGFVFYENYSTITVNPQDQRLRELFGFQ
jgi:predicted ribosome quality control (RQC) complex YloA/Tae2 family protein